MNLRRRFLEYVSNNARKKASYTLTSDTVTLLNGTTPNTTAYLTGKQEISLQSTYGRTGITKSPLTLAASNSVYNYYSIQIGSGYRITSVVITFRATSAATTLQCFDRSQSSVTSSSSADVKTITLQPYGDNQKEFMFNVSASTIINSIVINTETLLTSDIKYSTIFTSDNSGSNSYRIPAIVKLNDGRLLAVAIKILDNQAGGIGVGTIITATGKAARTDLVYKTSSDLGKTWSSEAILAQHSEIDNTKRAYGDASIAYDPINNKLYAYCCSGSISYDKSSITWTNNTTPASLANAIRVSKIVGTISGNTITWAAPVDITETIYPILNSAISTGTSPGNIQGIFFTSGRALYHNTYTYTKDTTTITIPQGFLIGAVTKRSQNGGNIAVNISLDGTTYQGLALYYGADESKLVEGNCPIKPAVFSEEDYTYNMGTFIGPIIFSRTSSSTGGNVPGIKVSRGDISDGVFTYTLAGHQGYPSELNSGYCINNHTNLGMLSLKYTGTVDKTFTIEYDESTNLVYNYKGLQNYLILKSSPFGSSGTGNIRKNLGIMWRSDIIKAPLDGDFDYYEGWYQIANDLSAYSDIVYLGNGKIGIMYEENINSNNNGYNIKFRVLDVEVLTKGAYKNADIIQ